MCWEFIFIISLLFLVKFPVWGLHLWLPKAHVEAPTIASILLAGLLLKLGSGGFIRLLFLLKFVFLSFWVVISFLGIILCSFICFIQVDSKSLAAYSSINHISFLLLGLVLLFNVSKCGVFILILGHGFSSTIIFYLIGFFYIKKGSRNIYYLNRILISGLFFYIFNNIYYTRK